ncbi:hypothetical protein BHM03_00005750 [Ensete ventricosum]|uniref:Uncharacterized protein n=1 Tax=Ensete ventricosum TaxID=4639 RepID=A0A445MBA8_ENSVE|nr:hypothetical protein BHM03_00005750 [Ensete ventricosum]
MTSSDSSSSVRVVSPPGSGETSRCDPEVGSSGASFGPPSPVDARVLRDLEVMMSDHDLDTAVTEGSLAAIRERYSIPAEYVLHVPQPKQRPYSLDAPDMCISVDALEAGLRGIASRSNTGCTFRSLGIAPIVWTLPACASRWMLWKPVSIWGFRLDWSAHPIGNASPYLSEEETVLVGRLKRILCLLTCRSGCKSDGSRQATREAPKASSKRPVGASPVREAPKASSKRSIDAAAEDAVTRHKKVKVLTRRHKSHLGERERRSRSKGKEPATPSEEPETPAGSEEGGVSPTHRRPRSMKDLFKTKVHKGDAGYYTLLMSDLGYQDPEKEMKARWKGLKNSTKVWNNSSAAEEFKRGLLHPQLARELYTLPSEVLMARAAKEIVLASEKELHEVQSNLADAQRLLKEARVRARKMDDELLQAVKALESARAELPK